jgi:hypothetical protein
MIAPRLACALALLLAAGRPALAGMPQTGTKNFTPSPATPSYFTDERDTPDTGPQQPAAPSPAAAAPAATMPPAHERASLASRPARLHRSRTWRRRPRVSRLAHQRHTGRR